MNRRIIFLLILILFTIAVFFIDRVVTINLTIWLFVGGIVLFFLPGYSIINSLFPANQIMGIERFALSLGISFITTTLGGLILNLMPMGLNKTSWLFLLGFITLFAFLISVVRRPYYLLNHELGLFKVINFGQAIILTLALTLTILAITIAQNGASKSENPGFTQLWILQEKSQTLKCIHIGVISMETSRRSFNLKVTSNENYLIGTFVFELNPGEKWEKVLAVPKTQTDIRWVEADLYFSYNPTIYRSVNLWLDP